jgi:hypothetical protein
MKIKTRDYNEANKTIDNFATSEWMQVEEVLSKMPLHLKASDQEGKKGEAIFDPVGTNEFIKSELEPKGWKHDIPIPEQYQFLGIHVDFGKNNILLEAQFSNYPFLLNNLLRAELFYRSGIQLQETKVKTLFLVTKAHMFPASNSTLYFEQASNQLDSLANYKVFSIPIRLIGLFENIDAGVQCVWTSYTSSRYSRTVSTRVNTECFISRVSDEKGRCSIGVAKDSKQKE